LSDDPNVNGAADPLIAGDEDRYARDDPASPAFRIQKISTDLTGDPNVLLAGETLRYTITVKNIGNGDASGVVLRDAVPVNTTYVAGSTTLNGAPVPGCLRRCPARQRACRSTRPPIRRRARCRPARETTRPTSRPSRSTWSSTRRSSTARSSRTRASSPPSRAASSTLPPTTPTPDRQRSDARHRRQRALALCGKNGWSSSSIWDRRGIVDPGDTLRYTITVQNSAAIPATGVRLTDAVPANTTYVANSTRLNGLPVGQPDGGVAPLASGIDISSSDLTPPLPGPAPARSHRGRGVLQFDLRVNLGTPAGTLISNQAVVDSVELPNLLTDGDGNPANGPEPTVVVVGAVQQLSITKQVTVVGGGAASRAHAGIPRHGRRTSPRCRRSTS
jgi:uncharacterized repeat protein (TIGR01451 family)